MADKIKINNVFYGGSNFPIPSHMNFGRLFVEKLEQAGDEDALIYGITGEKIRFGDLAKQIVIVASSMSKLGVKQGDVVAICSENRIEILISTIAMLYIGATATFLNIAYKKDEFVHTTSISKPKHVFLSSDAYELHYETLKEHSTVQTFIIYGETKAIGLVSFSQLINNGNADIIPADFYGRVNTALVLYSSGTTGMPKGVKITHLSFIVTSYHASFSSQDRILLVTPWCNAMGFSILVESLLYHKTVIFLRRFDENVYLQTIEKYKVNVLLIAPPVLIVLSKSSNVQKYDVTSVKQIHSGGAPLDTDVISLVKSRFPDLRNVTQSYGMTETFGAITKDTDIAPKQGSVGQSVTGVVLKIVDVKSSTALGPNQPGEICVKGLILFDGYIGKGPEGDYDEDGFFKTGDVGYYDEDGYIFIIDRIKELIKYNAWQVPPSELEAVLLLHPAVKDAGVVGTPDPSAGELPTAFVVKNPNLEVTENDIKEFVASKVSPWKKLRGGVKFINEIPRTGSGKILRRKLRELLQNTVAEKL